MKVVTALLRKLDFGEHRVQELEKDLPRCRLEDRLTEFLLKKGSKRYPSRTGQVSG
jgi:hypothetical protein